MDPAAGEDPDRYCCFDEWAVSTADRARHDGLGSKISRELVEALDAIGELAGHTVLDLGCGAGDVALATLRHGATTATGIDLGRGAIAQANELSRERHVDDRVRFTVGDASEALLDPHDVVVLNRVLCCYPKMDGLLANALPVARRIIAITAPPSRGVLGAAAKVEARIANVWYRLRDRKFRGFRVYIHDLGEVDARVRAAGFHPVVQGRRGFVWHLAVYERAA
jgi:magnesium-protoporphyrin O-methyltransferase